MGRRFLVDARGAGLLAPNPFCHGKGKLKRIIFFLEECGRGLKYGKGLVISIQAPIRG